jgi:hypothetical protein
MANTNANLSVASKFNVNRLSEQPLFATNPDAALPLLSMIGQTQLSIDDLLGQLSRQFIEQLLVLSAQSVAVPGTKAATPAKFAGMAAKAAWSTWVNPRCTSNVPGFAPPAVKWQCQPTPLWPMMATSRAGGRVKTMTTTPIFNASENSTSYNAQYATNAGSGMVLPPTIFHLRRTFLSFHTAWPYCRHPGVQRQHQKVRPRGASLRR